MEKECVERKLTLKWQKDLEINQGKNILDLVTAQLFEIHVLDLMEGVDRALVIADLYNAFMNNFFNNF